MSVDPLLTRPARIIVPVLVDSDGMDRKLAILLTALASDNETVITALDNLIVAVMLADAEMVVDRAEKMAFAAIALERREADHEALKNEVAKLRPLANQQKLREMGKASSARMKTTPRPERAPLPAPQPAPEKRFTLWPFGKGR